VDGVRAAARGEKRRGVGVMKSGKPHKIEPNTGQTNGSNNKKNMRKRRMPGQRGNGHGLKNGWVNVLWSVETRPLLNRWALWSTGTGACLMEEKWKGERVRVGGI